MTRENAAKIGVSEDRWLQRHLAAPFSTETVFLLSRLRCEISMSVFRGHNHKTTLKPGNTTNIGISRGFDDKFRWRKLRPNHVVNKGPRLVQKSVPHRGPFSTPRTVRGQSGWILFWVFEGHQTRGERVSVTFLQRVFLREGDRYYHHEPSKIGPELNTYMHLYIYIYML